MAFFILPFPTGVCHLVTSLESRFPSLNIPSGAQTHWVCASYWSPHHETVVINRIFKKCKHLSVLGNCDSQNPLTEREKHYRLDLVQEEIFEKLAGSNPECSEWGFQGIAIHPEWSFLTPDSCAVEWKGCWGTSLHHQQPLGTCFLLLPLLNCK